MKTTLRSLPYVGTLCLMLGACGSVTTRVEPAVEAPAATPAPSIDPHYQPVIDRDATYIDSLRAAPAPAEPQVIDGKSEVGDRFELSADGYVNIGNGRYPPASDESLEAAIALGKHVGAERVLIYRQDSNAGAETRSLLAAYYVKFRLLFGATFRDLTARERESLGLDGGVRIGGVIGDSPASQANLLPDDLVLSLNGTPIRGRSQFQELLKNNAGKTITLRVLRGTTRIPRVVRLGELPPTAKSE